MKNLTTEEIVEKETPDAVSEDDKADQGADQNADRGAEADADQGADQGVDQGADQETDQEADQDSEQEADQDSERDADQDEDTRAAVIAQGIVKWISIIAMVVATAVLSYVMISTARGELVDFFGRSFLRVVTGSMEPTILTGDYIIIDRNAVDDLKKDDIITFYSEEKGITGLLVTHRIIDIDENGDYITKGDANQIVDELHVRKDQIAGRYKGKARFLRWTGSFADRRKLLLVVVVIPFLLASIYEIYSMGKLWKQVAEERKKKSGETRKELEERLKREAIEEYLKSVRETETKETQETPVEQTESVKEIISEKTAEPDETASGSGGEKEQEA